MKNAKEIVLVGLSCLIVLLMACSKNKGIAGTYVDDNNKRNYLLLRADGSFFARESSAGISGRYRVDDDVITLTLDGSGAATQVKIHGNTLADDAGHSWTRGEISKEESGIASASTAHKESRSSAASPEYNQAAAASAMRLLNTAQFTYMT